MDSERCGWNSHVAFNAKSCILKYSALNESYQHSRETVGESVHICVIKISVSVCLNKTHQ